MKDWRARLQARAAAVPTIVVDVGRGYTKYTEAGQNIGTFLPQKVVQIEKWPKGSGHVNWM